jgi:hypothetical protein
MRMSALDGRFRGREDFGRYGPKIEPMVLLLRYSGLRIQDAACLERSRKKLRRYSRRLRADSGAYGHDARNLRSPRAFVFNNLAGRVGSQRAMPTISSPEFCVEIGGTTSIYVVAEARSVSRRGSV